MTPSRETITVAEAAQALGVSERTVWRYLKAGRLSGETVGEPGSQRTLISRDALETALAERACGDAAALRAERDRLVAELARLRAERDELAARVARLQRALARPARPGPLERILERAVALAVRLPLPGAARLG